MSLEKSLIETEGGIIGTSVYTAIMEQIGLQSLF